MRISQHSIWRSPAWLLVLTTMFGLQMLRLYFASVMAVYRDRLDAPASQLGVFVLVTFVLAFLAPLWPRLLGTRRALWFTAGGVTVMRLVLQLAPDALARWWLATAGVILFLWFMPVYLSTVRGTEDGRYVGAAWLAGFAIDTFAQGVFGSYDYAWRINLATILLALALAAACLALLWGSARRISPVGAGDGSWGDSWPLVGFGMALFLEALVWHNLAWHNTVWDRAPWLSMQHRLGPLTGLILATDVLCLYLLLAYGTRRAWHSAALPLLGTLLVAAGVVGIRQGLGLLFFLGHAGVCVFLILIGQTAAGQPVHRGASRATIAWAAGMLAFVILVFAYYITYDTRLPLDNQSLFFVAGAVLVLAGFGAWRAGRTIDWPEQPLIRPSLPVLGVICLGLLAFAGWGYLGTEAPTAPPGHGLPVRVMTYNQHFGFDTTGWSDLDALASEINASAPDIVALQEVSRGWYISGTTDMLAQLQARTKMPYARFAGAADTIWGNAILSRYPILDSGMQQLPRGYAGQKRNYLWAKVDLGNSQTLTVIATHLHHTEDAAGQALRLEQLPVLLDGWNGAARTVIVGDYNATPDSPEYAQLIAAGLRDAFLVAGGKPGDELTFTSDDPRRRIDYIWLSPDLRAVDFKATTLLGSDHRGIAVTVE